jgi:hypothetical protein
VPFPKRGREGSEREEGRKQRAKKDQAEGNVKGRLLKPHHRNGEGMRVKVSMVSMLGAILTPLCVEKMVEGELRLAEGTLEATQRIQAALCCWS